MDSGGRLAENPDASFLHEKFGKSSEMIGSVIEAHYNYEDGTWLSSLCFATVVRF